ncbi:SLC45 family MFS transporter [Salmonella enterica subsp. enterica]|nr:SLC45 family MFS transporter [Salmonella enterica subsp. enterica]
MKRVNVNFLLLSSFLIKKWEQADVAHKMRNPFLPLQKTCNFMLIRVSSDWPVMVNQIYLGVTVVNERYLDQKNSILSRDEQRVSWIFLAVWTLAQLGLWASLLTPANVGLALRVADIAPENKDFIYSTISCIGAIVAIFSNYLWGYLSDRTTSRFGMRRPYMIGGAIGTLVGAALMGTAFNITQLFIGWLVLQFSANAAITTFLAVIADKVPACQRGIASGFSGMCRTLGVLTGTFIMKVIPDSLFLVFVLPACVFILFTIIFLMMFDDKRLSRSDAMPIRIGEIFGVFGMIYRRVKREHTFGWTLASIFLLQCTIAVGQTYLVYFASDYVKIPRNEITSVAFYAVLIMNAFSCMTAPVAGYIADRINARRKVFKFSSVFLAAGVVSLLCFPDIHGYYAGYALIAVGFGVFEGLFIAVATTSATGKPDESVGADLGIINMAVSTPGIMLTFIAMLLVSGGVGANYVVLYGGSGILSLFALFTIGKIKSSKNTTAKIACSTE